MTFVPSWLPWKVFSVALCIAAVRGGQVGVYDTQDLAKTSRVTPPVQYTAFDDASWTIKSHNMTRLLGNQTQICEGFVTECTQNSDSCRAEDEDRVFMNDKQPPSVINYTDAGFKHIRAPDALFQLLQEFWDANKDRARIEYNDETAYHNSWQVPTTILMTEEEQFIGGGWNLSAAVWNAARDILEEWIGQKLAGSSVYGIRVYHNGSILTPHVDRLPLVSSAIINVAQDVEEDWPLEVYGHDGKATNVTMKPGDMVLYESHSVIHGRPFPMKGNFYANIFVHFQPMGDENSTEPLPEEGGIPPYLVEGSDWEEYYFDNFPDGWTLLTDVNELARRGDLYTMRYIAQRDIDALTAPDIRCDLMDLATSNRHIDIMHFFLFELGYDINMVCTAQTALDIARAFLAPDEAMTSFLVENGALSYDELLQKDPKLVSLSDSRCTMLRSAMEYDAVDVVEFLFSEVEFDINMVCSNKTPLDILLHSYHVAEEDPPTEETDPIFAYLQQNGAKVKILDPSTNNEQGSVDRCLVLSLAVAWESKETFEFLLGTMHYDINMICDSVTVLDLLYEFFEDRDHVLIRYLVGEGAKRAAELGGKGQERCATIKKAIQSGNIGAVVFLVEEMGYDVNLSCDGMTPLDLAHLALNNRAVVEYLVKNGGRVGRDLLRQTEGTKQEWSDEL